VITDLYVGTRVVKLRSIAVEIANFRQHIHPFLLLDRVVCLTIKHSVRLDDLEHLKPEVQGLEYNIAKMEWIRNGVVTHIRHSKGIFL